MRRRVECLPAAGSLPPLVAPHDSSLEWFGLKVLALLRHLRDGVSLIGALLLGITALVQGGTELADWSWRVWTSVIFLAIGGTALAFTWFADGVKRLGASKASVFVNLVPVFAVLQAAVLLDERLGIAVLGGGLLVIAGVWLTTNFSERTA